MQHHITTCPDCGSDAEIVSPFDSDSEYLLAVCTNDECTKKRISADPGNSYAACIEIPLPGAVIRFAKE